MPSLPICTCDASVASIREAHAVIGGPQISAKEVVHLRHGHRVGAGTKIGTTVSVVDAGRAYAVAITISAPAVASVFSHRTNVSALADEDGIVRYVAARRSTLSALAAGRLMDAIRHAYGRRSR